LSLAYPETLKGELCNDGRRANASLYVELLDSGLELVERQAAYSTDVFNPVGSEPPAAIDYQARSVGPSPMAGSSEDMVLEKTGTT